MRLGERTGFLPLFRAYKRVTGRNLGVVDRGTEIVIEGYPRSGNSYALVAFQLSQPTPVRIAHHVHGVSQIEAASHMGIPAILLVRDPVDAIASLIVRYQFLPISFALQHYVRYHSRTAEYVQDAVVAPFELVISHYDHVVEAVNQRFATKFQKPQVDAAFEEEIFDELAALDRQDRGSDVIDASTVARPSDRRQAVLRAVREKILHPRNGGLLERATELHRFFVEKADSPTGSL